MWLAEGSRSSCHMPELEDPCGEQWYLVSLAEEKVPGALSALGPCKLLFAQAATTGLWESGKEELNWEKMVKLLKCGKLRAGETTSSTEEEDAAERYNACRDQR